MQGTASAYRCLRYVKLGIDKSHWRIYLCCPVMYAVFAIVYHESCNSWLQVRAGPVLYLIQYPALQIAKSGCIEHISPIGNRIYLIRPIAYPRCTAIARI